MVETKWQICGWLCLNCLHTSDFRWFKTNVTRPVHVHGWIQCGQVLLYIMSHLFHIKASNWSRFIWNSIWRTPAHTNTKDRVDISVCGLQAVHWRVTDTIRQNLHRHSLCWWIRCPVRRTLLLHLYQFCSLFNSAVDESWLCLQMFCGVAARTDHPDNVCQICKLTITGKT